MLFLRIWCNIRLTLISQILVIVEYRNSVIGLRHQFNILIRPPSHFIMILLAVAFLLALHPASPAQAQSSPSSPPSEQSLPSHTVRIFGNISLSHYQLTLYIGTPPQPRTVIVDTGSDVLALPCDLCTNCGNYHNNPPINTSASSSLSFLTCQSAKYTYPEICMLPCLGKQNQKDQPCDFNVKYADKSSIAGVYLKDYINFENSSRKEGMEMAFGCITKQTNSFTDKSTDGIIGLSPGTQTQLLGKNKRALQFSLCLATNGGQMTIGRSTSNKTHTAAQPVTVGFDPSQGQYSLKQVGQIRFGSSVLKPASQGTGRYGLIIDSGSTIVSLPSVQFNTLISTLQATCRQQFTQCSLVQSYTGCFQLKRILTSSLQDQVNSIFPSLDIELAGKVVGWLPSRYFGRPNGFDDYVCANIQSFKESYVLGANWMVDRDIQFDLQTQTVTIFSNSTCELSGVRDNKVPAISPKKATVVVNNHPGITTQEYLLNWGKYFLFLFVFVGIPKIAVVLWAKWSERRKSARSNGLSGGSGVSGVSGSEERYGAVMV